MTDAATLPTDCEVDGQAFAFITAKPHVCRDGREIRLFRWRSSCEACGAPYVFDVPSSRAEFSPTRRCEDCRKPTSKAAVEDRRRERAERVQALYRMNPSLERQFPDGLPDWLVDPSTRR